MLKKNKIHLLESQEKTEIAYLKGAIENLGLSTDDPEKFIVPSGFQYHYKGEYQNLYITSNDKILKGDWAIGYATGFKGVGMEYFLWFHDDSNIEKLNALCAGNEKVVASTDKSVNLPRPSKSFINKYIEEFCKDNEIKEVLVEYYRRGLNSDGIDADLTGGIIIYKDDYYVPKIDKDNTITIKKMKISWDREEVIAMAKSLRDDLFSYIDQDNIGIDIEVETNKWINKTL